MTTQAIEYEIPASRSLNKVTATLKKELKLIEYLSEKLDYVCLDTFDWDLLKHRYVFEAWPQNNTTELRIRRLNSKHYSYSTTTPTDIDSSWILTDNQLRNKLSDLIDPDALLPQIRLLVKRHHLVKLTKNQKIVTRIIVESYHLFDTASGDYKKLQKRVVVTPFSGQVEATKISNRLIRKKMRFKPLDRDIVNVSADSLGINTLHQSPANQIAITADTRADLAVKSILEILLDDMSKTEDGVRKGVDPEALHNYRIAIRKSRSALKQIKAVFPHRTVTRFHDTLSWLGALTGPARDMDVYLQDFDNYRNELPPPLREHIDPLYKMIQAKKTDAYKTLLHALDSKRYDSFLLSYRIFLHTPTPTHTTLLNAGRPIKTVVDDRIWALYKRSLKLGRAIRKDSPAQDFHELRKLCKNLRYLMEFFINLHDRKLSKQLIKALKKLQVCLGSCNDLHIQAQKFHEFSVELDEPHASSSETQQSIAMIIQHLKETLTRERGNFFERYDKFSADTVRIKFKHSFKTKKHR
jgi:CHAD domain-containing protein